MKTLNRRSMLGGAALTAFCLPFGATLRASAQGVTPLRVCPLCQRRGMPFAGTPNDVEASSYVKIARSSGDGETDRFLGTALGRLANTFRVSPGFAFYDDSKGINAVAVRETLLGNGPGTVLMGMHLFGQLMARVRDGGITVIAVCAHEFGHIYQLQAGYERELAALDKTNRPFELHADFLAGYYLALRKAEHPELDLGAVGGVLYALGDTAFTSRQHHGTPDERLGALSAGFKFGTEGSHDIAEAAKAGFLLVKHSS
jgi:hypothetical protein